MFRQIMVPLDGSALAEGALAYAERLARLPTVQFERLGPTMHLVQVVAPSFIPLPMEPATYRSIAHTTAAEWLRAAAYLDGLRRRPGTSGLRLHTALLTGSLVASLLQYELQEGIDLVILGSHEEGGLGHLSLGSMMHRLLRRGAAPILVAHPAFDPASLRHAVVALDGSAGAEEALTLLSHLAPAVVGEVTLLRVVRSRDEIFAAFRYLSSLVRRPELKRLCSRPSVECGDPAERIVEMGRGRLVVLTQPRHWTPSQGVSRSIADRVICNGAAALLIARQGTQTASDNGSGDRILPLAHIPRTG